MYENTTIDVYEMHYSIKDTLTDNHHLRATMTIKRYSDQASRPSLPCQSIGPELPNGFTSKL